jgi:hypothetical protein
VSNLKMKPKVGGKLRRNPLVRVQIPVLPPLICLVLLARWQHIPSHFLRLRLSPVLKSLCSHLYVVESTDRCNSIIDSAS